MNVEKIRCIVVKGDLLCILFYCSVFVILIELFYFELLSKFGFVRVCSVFSFRLCVVFELLC